jgi:hypothetical protein
MYKTNATIVSMTKVKAVWGLVGYTWPNGDNKNAVSDSIPISQNSCRPINSKGFSVV